MRCASCAAENPAGARYCSQCGAEQSPPTPIAAVAAAVSGRRGHAGLARAANAAQADLPHEQEPEPERRSRASVIEAASVREARGRPEPRARPQPAATLAQPAYAHGPANGHLAAFLSALAFAIAAVAFGAWKMLGGELPSGKRVPGPDQSVMSSFPPEATPSPRRPIGSQSPVPASPSDALAPPSDASASPTPAAALPEAPATRADKAGETDGLASGSATQPIEIRPLPAKPAPRPAHRRAVPEKAQPAAQPPPVQTPVQPPVRATEMAAAPQAPAPAVDRWTRMADELSRCTREDFISRVICDQRVRFRYCGDYWGKVPQCPGSPAPERAQ
jgi:Meckel syndrome type 1 protein